MFIRTSPLNFAQPSTLEHQEARFQTHLGRLSAILRSYTTGTSYGRLVRNLPSDHGTLELQSLSCLILPKHKRSILTCACDTSLIESIRRTLIEQTHNPTPIPYSRLLNAEARQRQLEEAIESVRNRTSEFIVSVQTESASAMADSYFQVNSVTRQESVLERRLWEFSNRVQALEDKLSDV
jgi:hypothetical protein